MTTVKPAVRKNIERIGVALLSAALIFLLARTAILRNIERKTIDYRFIVRDALRKPAPRSPVLIVAIDAKSLERYSDPIALNDALMDAVTAVSSAKPAAIGFDVLHISSVDASKCNYDRGAFLETIAASRKMVIPYYLMAGDVGMPVYVADLMAEAMGIDRSDVQRFRGAAKLKLLDAAQKMLPVRFGYANLSLDPDGVSRDLALTSAFGDSVLPGFALSIYLRGAFHGADVKLRATPSLLQAGPIAIPLSEGRLFINYAAPPGGFPHISIADVLDHKRDAAYMHRAFSGRIVLVGAYDYSIPDFHSTPYTTSGTNNMFGVEIIANVIDTIVQKRFIQVESAAMRIAVLLIACILAVLVLAHLPLWKGAAALAVLMAAYAAAAQYTFSNSRFLLDLTPVLIALPFAFLLGHLHNTLVLDRHKRFIQRVLGSYLDPRIVRSLADSSDATLLQGRRREITVLFSDIRGFTTLSEKLQPEQVVELLNVHLSTLSDIIMRSGGMVDKYVGDCIMAVWNAPNDIPDHRLLACETALKMQESLPGIRSTLAEKGIALDSELRIGVGLNTGYAVVGNIGSERKSDYTAIGDVVNVASRLESLNKQFGTGIIISASTAESIRERIRIKDLGAVPVKGRNEPVAIFELIAIEQPQER